MGGDDHEAAPAPALITMGATPDIASPDVDDAVSVAAARRTPLLLRIFTEPMWVLGLVVLMDEVDKNIVSGMVTPLKEYFGLCDVDIGVLFTMQLLFNGLITVPAGYLAD